jgi:3-oxoacyl-[acyl-carrier-protein] synthase II
MLRVISTRDLAAAGEDPSTASRPFDRSRDGFVLGEGAWAVVVERTPAVGPPWSDLAPRNPPAEPASPRVQPIGELLGYGATCDAYHRVRPAPDMEESARAMRMAVRDAGLRMGDVELIHYHGTATRLNDQLETAAVKLAFGEHAQRLRGTSVKSMIGHPQGACGLASLVATLGALTTPGLPPFVPPTINLHDQDIEGGCDLNYTANRAVETDGRTALINCLAFGAKNTAVVVRAGGES